jgi:hypothetical protein
LLNRIFLEESFEPTKIEGSQLYFPNVEVPSTLVRTPQSAANPSFASAEVWTTLDV